MRRAKGPEQEVQSATAVPASRKDDQSARMISYLWQMGLRVVCFVGAVLAFLVLHWTWLGWVLVGAAAILPNTAVIVANATARRRIDSVDGVRLPDPSAPPRALGR